MRFTLRTNQTKIRTSGFTLIEVLIIAPIVVLVIGGFVALMMSMVGDVLLTRDQNVMAYETQDALDRIEQDTRIGTQFLNTSRTLAAPQGSDDGIAAFSSSNSLIIGALATDKNPASFDRQLIYYANQPSPCGSTQGQNRVFVDKLIYYIKNGSLWRRVVVPSYDLNGTPGPSTLCSAPWQQNSCTPGYTISPPCQTDDTEVMKNIESLSVKYYDSPSGANELTGTAILNASTIDVTITGKKTVVGKSATSSGTIRASKLNSVDADIPPPTSPVVSHTTTITPDPTATFTWANAQNATSYKVTYQINGGTPVVVDVSGATVSYQVSASRKDTVSFKVASVNTSGQSPDSNDSVTFPTWTDLDLQNDWENYGGSYNTPQYTKTNTGIVFLKGLVRYGTDTQGTVIATLPPGYRPSGTLVYQVATNASVDGRMDVEADGDIVFYRGSNGWMSLDGVAFMQSGAPAVGPTPTWTTLMTTTAGPTGWSSWGGVYTPVRTATDNIGRIHIQGLARAGTQTSNTTIVTLPNANQRPPKTLHFPGGGSADSTWWVWYATGEIIKRGPQTSSYIGLQAIYYPGSVGSWSTTGSYGPTAPWVNFGGNYPDLQYTKASDGVVTIRGVIKNGGNTQVAPLLPPGYRPPNRSIFTVTSGDAFGRVDIDATGSITAQTVNNVSLPLNLSFIAD